MTPGATVSHHPDADLGQVAGQREGERHDPALGRHVGRLPRLILEAGDRGDITMSPRHRR